MIDRISRAILELFAGSVRELENALQKQVLSSLFDQDTINQRQLNLARVNSIYSRMETLFAGYAAAETKRQYKAGVNLAAETLGYADTTASIDAKTIGSFVQEMLDDFTRGTNGGRKTIGTFFVFSKQGILTENEMTAIMARGWIKEGTGRQGMRDLADALRAKLDSSKMTRLSPAEIDGLTKVAIEKYRKAGVPPQFLSSMEKMLKEQKFLRLINKNGDPMHFRVNHYAELVARTRTGNAQVHGAIEQANAYGVTEFQVTSHNTETEVCKPHEGKIYTTDPNNSRFEYLSPENRPLYHILCKHRLLPRAFTRDELAAMPNLREGPSTPSTPEDIVAARNEIGVRSHDFAGNVQVVGDQQEFAGQVVSIFGRSVPKEDIAKMAGASGMDSVQMGAREGGDGIVVEVAGPNIIDQQRIITRRRNGDLELYNSIYTLIKNTHGQGIGRTMLEQEVATLRSYGFARIMAICARGEEYNGYISWAKMGYDGEIPSFVRRKLPVEWKDASTVQDLMALPGGPKWWEENGYTFNGTFDLADNSRSMKTFIKYLESKRK